MPAPDEPRRWTRRRAWFAGGTVLLPAAAAAVIIGWLAEGAPAGNPQSYTCVEVGVGPTEPSDDRACERRAEDRARRRQLPEAQKARLADAEGRAMQAVLTPGTCAGARQLTGRCAGFGLADRRGTEPPGPVETAALRHSFDQAGYPGGTVRIAGDADLGPRGSIVFGVPVSDACYVGYLVTLQGPGSYGLTGPLPGGACL